MAKMDNYQEWLTDELDDEVTRHPANSNAQVELDRRWNVPAIRTVTRRAGEITESLGRNSQYKEKRSK